MELLTLYRPVGPEELDFIARSGWTRFPPRLRRKTIFYHEIEKASLAEEQPVDHICRNTFIIRIHMLSDYLKRFSMKDGEESDCEELCIPLDRSEEFNNHIIGLIELTK